MVGSRLLILLLAACAGSCHPAARAAYPHGSRGAQRRPVAQGSAEAVEPEKEHGSCTTPVAAAPRVRVLEELPVPGHGAAVLALPSDLSGPRPVLIAAHGAGDTPTWQCRIWRDILQARGFVLCPRGTQMGWGGPPDEQGFFYRDHHALEREVLAALDALRGAYPAIADTDAAVYTGYSQGATMGALMAVKHPQQFPRLVLVEGGEREWDVPTAMRFRKGGGARVMLVCGRTACANPARKSLFWIRKGGVEGRLEVVPRGGHTYGGLVAERLRDVFAWVVEGDARWGNEGRD